MGSISVCLSIRLASPVQRYAWTFRHLDAWQAIWFLGNVNSDRVESLFNDCIFPQVNMKNMNKAKIFRVHEEGTLTLEFNNVIKISVIIAQIKYTLKWICSDSRSRKI